MSRDDTIRRWMEEAGCEGIKPSGDNLIATCPFYPDDPNVHTSRSKTTGYYRSFSMNAETGQFICFSESCGESGGLILFLVNALGFPFDRALAVAQEFGVEGDYDGPTGWETDFPEWGERRRRREAEDPSPFPDAQLGLYDFCPKYLLRRGFRKSTLKEWEIGWDVEKKQVIFPVRNEKGRLVGVSRRKTREDGPGAKYLHLEFKRNRFLYGAHLAKDASEAWVGEGQLDAVALAQIGLPEGARPVSTMGSRVGPKQIQLLSRFPRVVLAFDGDSSGVRAALKTGDGLAEYGTETFVADLWRRRKRYKDPAELLEKKASDKVLTSFITDLEPYEDFLLRWLRLLDARTIRTLALEKERPRLRRAG